MSENEQIFEVDVPIPRRTQATINVAGNGIIFGTLKINQKRSVLPKMNIKPRSIVGFRPNRLLIARMGNDAMRPLT